MRNALVCLLIVAAACGPTTKHAPACTAELNPGDLVITEVFADSADGADAGKEWFEIFNNTGDPVELEGLVITASRPDGSSPQQHVMRELVIAPGQYLTLGNSAQADVAAWIAYGYDDDLGSLYNTGGGALALQCGDVMVDQAGYDSVKPGHSREFTDAQPPDATLNDDAANWCEGDETEFSPNDYGTPGTDNDCQPVVVGACDDNGTMRQAVAPNIGDVVITEIMPNPKAVSATVGQWFEIEAINDVDLNGVGLDRANDSTAPEVLDSGACIHMAASSFAVFARSADSTANGGIDALGTFDFSLSPTSNPDVQLVYGNVVLDQVTWTTAPEGASLQLDPSETDPASNDDISNFCAGTQIYDTIDSISDLGTPGAINDACSTTPPSGQCNDNGNMRAIVTPPMGALVISELLPNAAGTGTDPTQEWFELANVGSAAFDLNELGFQGNAQSVNVLHAADCKPVAAGGFALFAHSTDPTVNGGLPTVDATFSFALSTELTVYTGTTVLDTVTLANPQPKDGVSRQVKPAELTTTGNDSAANFCDAVPAQQYGSAANYGTPRAPNICM
ncbi:MAG TPA: lamin tail domain-containing protein [Kofleriaceae bacterium]|jgi:hypothetical protein